MTPDIQEGLMLMVLGMGVVSSFLVIMVVLMKITAGFFKKFAHLFPEKEEPEVYAAPVVADDSIEIAVAIAAVKAHTHK